MHIRFQRRATCASDYLEIDLDGDPVEQEPKLRALCHDLLSNPVISYRLKCLTRRSKFAVVQFPGSTATRIAWPPSAAGAGLSRYVWHKETSLEDWDAIVCPADFPTAIIYAGAIARFSRRSCVRWWRRRTRANWSSAFATVFKFFAKRVCCPVRWFVIAHSILSAIW